MDGQITYAKRKFGHSEIEWTLSNYCLSPSGLEWEIHSPDFFVDGVTLTKWRMTLKRAYVPDLKTFSNTFKLTRVEHGNENQMVFAQCHLVIDGYASDWELDTDEDEPVDEFFVEFEGEFSANTTYERVLGTFEHENFMKELELCHRHDITFQLMIILLFEGEEEIVSSCYDLLIKELSEDLLYMYETANCFDVHLRVGDKYIRAHRGVLYRRIQNRSINEKLYNHILITLDQDDNFDAWNKVLKFVYTANMRHVLVEPNLNIYNSAKELGIEPVITYYEPHKIHLHSTTEVEELNVTWVIENFLERKERFLYSPELLGTKGQRCRLKIFPKSFGVLAEGSTGVFVQMEVETEKDICIVIFIQRGDSKDFLYIFHKRVIGREVFGDRRMIECELNEDCILDGKVILHFNIRIPTGKQNTFSGSSSYECKPYSEQKNYEELSEDMFSLYRHADCCDAEINVEENNHAIQVHRYILHTRHPYLFASYFESNNTVISRLNKETMERLLEFLYSGKIRGIISIFCIVQLFEVAEVFKTFALKLAVINNIHDNFHLFDYDYVQQLADIAEKQLKAISNNMDCFPIA